MLTEINIDPIAYQTAKPFPHLSMDDFLNAEFAKDVQAEILSLPDTEFDRYDNPFEQKHTLRNKYNYPKKLNSLMNELTSETFIMKLSKLTGYNLINDPDRNFWGVHKYRNGDWLDIHVDAGIHPKTHQKKQVTLGIYLSYNWKIENKCDLQLWKGDNAKNNDAKIYECITEIPPLFNKLVIFTCDDYSWHGNPEPMIDSNDTSKRIFVTVSYLSDNQNFENKRQKAFFVARPNDPFDENKDKLRLLRADPEKYKEIYRLNTK